MADTNSVFNWGVDKNAFIREKASGGNVTKAIKLLEPLKNLQDFKNYTSQGEQEKSDAYTALHILSKAIGGKTAGTKKAAEASPILNRIYNPFSKQPAIMQQYDTAKKIFDDSYSTHSQTTRNPAITKAAKDASIENTPPVSPIKAPVASPSEKTDANVAAAASEVAGKEKPEQPTKQEEPQQEKDPTLAKAMRGEEIQPQEAKAAITNLKAQKTQEFKDRAEELEKKAEELRGKNDQAGLAFIEKQQAANTWNRDKLYKELDKLDRKAGAGPRNAGDALRSAQTASEIRSGRSKYVSMNPAERLAQRMKEAGHSSVSKVANVAKRGAAAIKSNETLAKVRSGIESAAETGGKALEKGVEKVGNAVERDAERRATAKQNKVATPAPVTPQTVPVQAPQVAPVVTAQNATPAQMNTTLANAAKPIGTLTPEARVRKQYYGGRGYAVKTADDLEEPSKTPEYKGRYRFNETKPSKSKSREIKKYDRTDILKKAIRGKIELAIKVGDDFYTKHKYN